jgi:hypothetical protein
VNDMIDAEIKRETRSKRNNELQLRSDGTFVRVIASRIWPAASKGSVPIRKEGPVS